MKDKESKKLTWTQAGFMNSVFAALLFLIACGDNENIIGRDELSFLGLDGKIVQKLRLHGDFLYAATDDGVYRKDLGKMDTLWTPIGFQGNQTSTLLVFNVNTIMVSVEFDSISLYRTTDGGETWSPFQNGFGGEFPETVWALEKIPNQSETIFATGAAVVAKSTDGGGSWKVVWGGWQFIATGTAFVKFDPNKPNIVWSGGQNAIEEGYLLKSIDTGENWLEWQRIVDDVSVAKTAAIHPFNSDIVYVGLESYILKTTNGGETWEEIIIAPGRFFFGIAINSYMPSRVYAVSWFKTSDPQPLILHISDDGGDSWQEIVEENVRFGGAFDLLHVSDGNTDKLYLALWKGGVYEFRTDVTMAIGMQNVTKPITMLQNVRELVR
ncbi:hypothetical protein E3V36_07355 [Candidatus Marinimicrobia bacterium MT.SAG.2]|nr:hypothetical protein E3V36_07355 [Candidatus Marinimicrobia bacterium MT.SAG.2]